MILFFQEKLLAQHEEKPLTQQSTSTRQKFQTHVIKKTGDSWKLDKAKCPVCDDHHNIEECHIFLSQTMGNRSKIPHRKKYAVDDVFDNAKSCAKRKMCKVCSERHPTVLHGLDIKNYKKKGNNEDTATKENKPEEVKCASTNTGSDVISMCIVPVQIKSKDTSKTGHSYTLLDSCSQGTFILDQLTSDLMIKTINGEFTNNSTASEHLEVPSISEDDNEWLSMPRTFTRPDLPGNNITKRSHLRRWKYLENVMNQLTFGDYISVQLLIGANCTKALKPIEILQSRNGGPYAFKT